MQWLAPIVTMVSEELQPLIPIVTLVRQKSQWFITKGFNHQWLQWFITKGCNHLPLIDTITNSCICSSKQLQWFTLMVSRIHLNIQQKRWQRGSVGRVAESRTSGNRTNRFSSLDVLGLAIWLTGLAIWPMLVLTGLAIWLVLGLVIGLTGLEFRAWIFPGSNIRCPNVATASFTEVKGREVSTWCCLTCLFSFIGSIYMEEQSIEKKVLY